MERQVETTTDTKSIEKPTSPEEFECLFKTEVLKDIRESKKKLLIIFDNLDRCDSETVLKTLRGINTFLGEKDCVYVIPCDPDAIRKHLKNQLYQMEEKTTDPYEFLRKVFQVSIDIHPLIFSDIKCYAENLIDQTSLDKHPKRRQIIHVITQGFVSSPRKIKEILNNLTIRHFLAKKLEEQRKIASNVITENIDFLAKLMVIKEEWPDFYEEILKDVRIYKGAIDYIENKAPIQIAEGSKEAIDNFYKNRVLRRFLEGTKTIQHENIELFLRFNQDPLEVTIPETKRIKDALIFRKTNELIELFESVKNDVQKIKEFTEIIEMAMREEEAKEGLINILDSTCKIIDYVSGEMKSVFSENICFFLDQSHLRQSVHSLDLECFNIFRNVKPTNQNLKSVLREFVNVLNKSETFPEKKLDALFQNSQIITEEVVFSSVNEFFETRFKDFQASIPAFLSRYDKQITSKFLRSSFVKNKLEGSISNKRTEENQDIINLYLSLRSMVDPKERNRHFITKMIEILRAETSNAYDEPKKFAFNNLEKIKFEIPTELVDPLLGTLDSMQALIEQTMPQPQAFKALSSIYVALYPIAESRKQKIESKLSHLIGHEQNYYERILNELKNSEKPQSYTYLIGFMTKAYIQAGEYKKKRDDEKSIFLKMLYEEYYREDIKYFCEHLIFGLLRETNSALYRFGLLAINRYNEEIIANGLGEKNIQILTEEIAGFEDGEGNYEPLSDFLETILLFSRKSNDKSFIDKTLSDLALSFLRSKKVIEKKLMKNNFSKIKDSLSEDEAKRVVDNIALNLLEEIMAISYEDPSFDIILDNQDSVDEKTLHSLKNHLRSLNLEKEIDQKKKYFYYFPRMQSLTKNEIKRFLGDLLTVARDEKVPPDLKQLVLDSMRKLEPRVDSDWPEWKEFESLAGGETKQQG